MHKAKQSQDRKRLKLGNVRITKETSCWEWQGFVLCLSFRKVRLFFFFLIITWLFPYMQLSELRKENTFTAQISFILGANCRYIDNLQDIVRWFTSKLFWNSKFNFGPFFFNLGPFRAKSRLLIKKKNNDVYPFCSIGLSNKLFFPSFFSIF